MTYPEFERMFKDFLTGKQIADMQDVAFSCYQDAHGYWPQRKEQKQIAYSFIQDLFYNMEVDDCIDFLEPFGVDYKRAEAFWQSLEWIRGE